MNTVLIPVGTPVTQRWIGDNLLVRETLLLDQTVSHVHPEAIDASIEPESEHPAEHLAYLGVLPVQIWLGSVKEVEIPLTGGAVSFGDPRPCGPPKDGLPVVRGELSPFALSLTEHIALTFR